MKGKRGGVLTNGHVLYLKSESGGKGIHSGLSRTNFSNINGITIKGLLAAICLFSSAMSSNFKLTM